MQVWSADFYYPWGCVVSVRLCLDTRRCDGCMLCCCDLWFWSSPSVCVLRNCTGRAATVKEEVGVAVELAVEVAVAVVVAVSLCVADPVCVADALAELTAAANALTPLKGESG